MDKIRILIVEDDPLIAQDIREHLEQMDYQVSAIAYDAPSALNQLAGNLPDLALLDINLGDGKDGIEIAEIIRDRYPLPFVFLTSYAGKQVLERAKPTRPMGYIVKPFDEKDLFATIEIALYNYAQRWQPESWEAGAVNHRLRTDLTTKEVEILQDIFEGKTNRQLCEKHFLSLNTIKTHVQRIYDKLDVHSRSEAMALLRKALV